jgi:hypothetical protein
MLVDTLIICFLLLLIIQIYLAFTTIEGFEGEYKEYDKNDPMFLSKQNAANIDVLKQRIDKMLGLETSVSKVNTRMDIIESQIKDAKSQSNADIAELSKPKQDISVSGLFNEKK